MTLGTFLTGNAYTNQRKLHLESATCADNPWDQRLCLVPDGDLFKQIRSGNAQTKTDRRGGPCCLLDQE